MLRMSSISKVMKVCAHCEYTTNREYNMKRHMILVHNITEEQSEQNVHLDQQYVRPVQQYVHQKQQNVHPEQQYVHPIQHKALCAGSASLLCNLCGKCLSSRQRLQTHIAVCKGTSNPLQCDVCFKVLSSRSSLLPKNFN